MLASFIMINGVKVEQQRFNPFNKREKTNRIKTNNHELLIRKQNESDATS